MQRTRPCSLWAWHAQPPAPGWTWAFKRYPPYLMLLRRNHITIRRWPQIRRVHWAWRLVTRISLELLGRPIVLLVRRRHLLRLRRRLRNPPSHSQHTPVHHSGAGAGAGTALLLVSGSGSRRPHLQPMLRSSPSLRSLSNLMVATMHIQSRIWRMMPPQISRPPHHTIHSVPKRGPHFTALVTPKKAMLHRIGLPRPLRIPSNAKGFQIL